MVAIAPTIYRLTMQMDNDLIQKFEDDNPDDNDSARKGKSSLTSAVQRELKVEMATANGEYVWVCLWDIEKNLTASTPSGYAKKR